MKNFNSIIDLIHQFPDEKSCKIYLANLRFDNGKDLYCPHCGGTEKIYVFKDKITYKCGDCKLKFNSRTGTIFDNSKIPLQKWFLAVYLLTSHKKGISSIQASKDLNVTQKTAWFMLHRIRYAITNKTWDKPLSNVIEIDETYIGGKSKNKHAHKRTEHTQGRSTTDKTPVFGMVERNGEVRAIKVTAVDMDTLKPIIIRHVNKSAIIMSDEWRSYSTLSKVFKGHRIVKHGQGEYVNGDCHTNNIENFWSHFKRGIIGIYHYTSPKHLDLYINEFTFRYNSRSQTEFDRFNLMLSKSIGKLTYKDLTKH